MKSTNLLRATMAAGTLGTLLASTALFAGIAAADTTGYETGYNYHQGLATGAGAQLENNSSSATANTSAVQSTANTSNTTATTPSSASVDTTGSGAATTPAQSTAPAATPSQQAAVAPAANAATDNTAPAIALSQPVMVGLWVVLGLAVLALIALGISAIINAVNASSEEDAYTRRRAYYQS